jgi:hypothetical protein
MYNQKILLTSLSAFVIAGLAYNYYWQMSVASIDSTVRYLLPKTLSSSLSKTMCFINPSASSWMSENYEEFLVNYNNCQSTVIKQRNRVLDLPVVTSAFFRSLGDAVLDHSNTDITKYRTKPYDIWYIGQEMYGHFIKYLPSISAKFILISHWSDLNISINEYRVIVENPYLIVWFSTNVVDSHEKLRILPQGLWPDGVYGWRGAPALSIVSLNLISFRERKTLLYIPTWQTYIRWPGRSDLRQHLCDKFRNRTDVYCPTGNKRWQDYMLTMGHAKFVISPPGRGFDCFRTWEALLVGAVPIVLNSSLNPLYSDMPIMIIESYQQLTIEHLNDFERTLRFRNGIIAPRYKLWARYWMQEIYAYMPTATTPQPTTMITTAGV